MKALQFTSTFLEYNSIDELSAEDSKLMELAMEVRDRAYSPYSKFKVGAAILLSNGEMVTGSNQENAAYPSGMCAERVAIWSASSLYPGVTIKKIVISGKSDLRLVDKPVSPCGACRQAINEYEVKQQSNIEILFTGEKGAVIKSQSIKELLPFNFDGSLL